MTRPVARRIAQPRIGQNPGSEAGSLANSPGEVGALAPAIYVTAARLDRIAAGLSERDEAVLSFVAASRLASSLQLVKRFWTPQPTTDRARARAALRALKRLTDWRILDPLPDRPRGGVGGGSTAHIYTVGVAGRKLLVRRGLRLRRLDAPGARLRHHLLACTETVVQLYLAHDRGDLDLIEVQQEPASHRAFLGSWGTRLWVRPDLFIRVGVGALEDRLMIEVDLSTEHAGTILAKANRYLAHYRAGSEQRDHGVYPRVVWSVPDQRRANEITGVLRRLPAEARPMFAVCLSDELVAWVAREARS